MVFLFVDIYHSESVSVDNDDVGAYSNDALVFRFLGKFQLIHEEIIFVSPKNSTFSKRVRGMYKVGDVSSHLRCEVVICMTRKRRVHGRTVFGSVFS